VVRQLLLGSRPRIAINLAAPVADSKTSPAGSLPGNRLEQERSSRGSAPIVKAWVAAVLLHGLIIATGHVSEHTAIVVNDVAWTIASILAAVSSFRAARSSTGAERSAWLVFTAACGAWAAGQIVWDVYELYLGISVPFPSYADIGYLIYGPLMVAGLFLLRATQQERGLTWLRTANLGLILCSLALVLITVFTQPFSETRRPPLVSLIVVGENASITVAFIVAMYFLWSYRWGNRLLAYSLVTLSVGSQMICGLLYTRELIVDNYGAFSVFNIGWTIAFGLHQLAAEAQVTADTGVTEDSAALRRGHALVEALVPSFLLICVAVTAALLAEEITTRTIHLSTLILDCIRGGPRDREAWLYLRGEQLRTALDSSVNALTHSRGRLDEVNAQRSELERQIEVTARAGGVGCGNGTCCRTRSGTRTSGNASSDIRTTRSATTSPSGASGCIRRTRRE
jgi:hypothetical protein